MKKILFIMMIMLIGVNSISFAEYIDLDAIGSNTCCIMCGECPDQIHVDVDAAEGNSGTKLCLRSSDGYVCPFCAKPTLGITKIENLKSIYSGIPDRLFGDEKFDHSCLEKNKFLESIVSTEYIEAKDVFGGTYYIHPRFLHSEDRLLYLGRGIFLHFNKKDIDLYADDDTGERVTGGKANKIRAGNIYSDTVGSKYNVSLEAVEPNTGTRFDDAYLLCNECSKCDTCNRNVASSGSGYVSRYCEGHACAFVWDVEIGEGCFEGVECKEANNGGDYCDSHECRREGCSEPIIGLNLNNSLLPTNFHSGGSFRGGYSNYCLKHCCEYQGCFGTRISTNATNPIAYSGKCKNYPYYCEIHCSMCGVCGKPVEKSAYDKVGKMICEECIGGNFKQGEEGPVLDKYSLSVCDGCGCETTTLKTWEGNRYCVVCFLNHSGISDGIASEETIIDYLVESTRELSPEILEERFEELGVSLNALEEYFEQKGICGKCQSPLSTFWNNETYCPNCEIGRFPPNGRIY